MSMVRVSATVNGNGVTRDISARSTLAEFLRVDLGLNGTKVSCELQVCGVCTVLVDGLPVSSCTYLAVDIDGLDVLTIEGMAEGENLHVIQQAFVDHFALQCGFCTPGFVMMAKALLDQTPRPSRSEVEQFLEGNICRCTGYEPIVDAILDASRSGLGKASDENE
jgi:aerobic-type carbon monoxide dehydrogenase small subunit (CoxS/CutS family)